MLGVAVIEMTAKLIVPAAVLVGVRRYHVPSKGCCSV